MTTIIIAGRVSDVKFAKCQQIGNQLAFSIPNVTCVAKGKDDNEWTPFIKSVCSSFDFVEYEKTQDPLVWTSVGRLIGGPAEFIVYIKDFFGIDVFWPEMRQSVDDVSGSNFGAINDEYRMDEIAKENIENLISIKDRQTYGVRLRDELPSFVQRVYEDATQKDPSVHFVGDSNRTATRVLRPLSPLLKHSPLRKHKSSINQSNTAKSPASYLGSPSKDEKQYLSNSNSIAEVGSSYLRPVTDWTVSHEVANGTIFTTWTSSDLSLRMRRKLNLNGLTSQSEVISKELLTCFGPHPSKEPTHAYIVHNTPLCKGQVAVVPADHILPVGLSNNGSNSEERKNTSLIESRLPKICVIGAPFSGRSSIAHELSKYVGGAVIIDCTKLYQQKVHEFNSALDAQLKQSGSRAGVASGAGTLANRLVQSANLTSSNQLRNKSKSGSPAKKQQDSISGNTNSTSAANNTTNSSINKSVCPPLLPYISDHECERFIDTILLPRLHQEDCSAQGWILIGLGESDTQINALIKRSIIPSMVVFIDTPLDTLVERASDLRFDPVTGETIQINKVVLKEKPLEEDEEDDGEPRPFIEVPLYPPHVLLRAVAVPQWSPENVTQRSKFVRNEFDRIQDRLQNLAICIKLKDRNEFESPTHKARPIPVSISPLEAPYIQLQNKKSPKSSTLQSNSIIPQVEYEVSKGKFSSGNALPVFELAKSVVAAFANICALKGTPINVKSSGFIEPETSLSAASRIGECNAQLKSNLLNNALLGGEVGTLSGQRSHINRSVPNPLHAFVIGLPCTPIEEVVNAFANVAGVIPIVTENVLRDAMRVALQDAQPYSEEHLQLSLKVRASAVSLALTSLGGNSNSTSETLNAWVASMPLHQIIPEDLISDVLCERLLREDGIQQGWCIGGAPFSTKQACNIERRIGVKPQIVIHLASTLETAQRRFMAQSSSPASNSKVNVPSIFRNLQPLFCDHLEHVADLYRHRLLEFDASDDALLASLPARVASECATLKDKWFNDSVTKSAFNSDFLSTIETFNEELQDDIFKSNTPPMKISIIGAPGIGKTSQSSKLADLLQARLVNHSIAIGWAVRRADKFEPGAVAKICINKDRPVPESTIVECVLGCLDNLIPCSPSILEAPTITNGMDELEATKILEEYKDIVKQEQIHSTLQGWILDGFPSNGVQAAAMAKAGIVPDAVFMLRSSDKHAIERITGRRIDPDTGENYHIDFKKPENSRVQARLIQLEDDTPPIAALRLKEAKNSAMDVLKHYSSPNHGAICVALAAGIVGIDKVFKSLRDSIRQLLMVRRLGWGLAECRRVIALSSELSVDTPIAIAQAVYSEDADLLASEGMQLIADSGKYSSSTNGIISSDSKHNHLTGSPSAASDQSAKYSPTSSPAKIHGSNSAQRNSPRSATQQPGVASTNVSGPLGSLKICITGAPITGKSTFCRAAVNRLKLVTVSVLDSLDRFLTATQLPQSNPTLTELKAKYSALRDSTPPDNLESVLLEDNDFVEVIIWRLQEPDCLMRGWVLQNFPQTANQAASLLSFETNVVPDLILNFSVDEEAAVERYSQWMCEQKNVISTTVNVSTSSPTVFDQVDNVNPNDQAFNSSIIDETSSIEAQLTAGRNKLNSGVKLFHTRFSPVESGKRTELAPDVDLELNHRFKTFSHSFSDMKTYLIDNFPHVFHSIDVSKMSLEDVLLCAFKKAKQAALQITRRQSLNPTFIVSGVPLSGATHIAIEISSFLNIVRIDPEDLLRKLVKDGNHPEAKTILDAFIKEGINTTEKTDDFLAALVADRLKKADAVSRGWIIEGLWPRSNRHMFALSRAGVSPQRLLLLCNSLNVSLMRGASRVIDPVTGIKYSAAELACLGDDKVAGRVIHSADDSKDNLESRYHAAKSVEKGLMLCFPSSAISKVDSSGNLEILKQTNLDIVSAHCTDLLKTKHNFSQSLQGYPGSGVISEGQTNRIVIIGEPGAGKTTLAKKLKDKLGVILITVGNLFEFALKSPHNPHHAEVKKLVSKLRTCERVDCDGLDLHNTMTTSGKNKKGEGNASMVSTANLTGALKSKGANISGNQAVTPKSGKLGSNLVVSTSPKGTKTGNNIASSSVAKSKQDDFLKVPVHSVSGLSHDVDEVYELQLKMDELNNIPPVGHSTLIAALLKLRLSLSDCMKFGWVLDNVPCTAGNLQCLFEEENSKPSLILSLHCGDVKPTSCESANLGQPLNLEWETHVMPRITGKRVDPLTSKSYHIKFNPAPSTPAIQQRLQVAPEDSEPYIKLRCKSFLEHFGLLQDLAGEMIVSIDSRRSADEIFRVAVQACGLVLRSQKDSNGFLVNRIDHQKRLLSEDAATTLANIGKNLQTNLTDYLIVRSKITPLFWRLGADSGLPREHDWFAAICAANALEFPPIESGVEARAHILTVSKLPRGLVDCRAVVDSHINVIPLPMSGCDAGNIFKVPDIYVENLSPSALLSKDSGRLYPIERLVNLAIEDENCWVEFPDVEIATEKNCLNGLKFARLPHYPIEHILVINSNINILDDRCMTDEDARSTAQHIYNSVCGGANFFNCSGLKMKMDEQARYTEELKLQELKLTAENPDLYDLDTEDDVLKQCDSLSQQLSHKDELTGNEKFFDENSSELLRKEVNGGVSIDESIGIDAEDSKDIDDHEHSHSSQLKIAKSSTESTKVSPVVISPCDVASNVPSTFYNPSHGYAICVIRNVVLFIPYSPVTGGHILDKTMVSKNNYSVDKWQSIFSQSSATTAYEEKSNMLDILASKPFIHPLGYLGGPIMVPRGLETAEMFKDSIIGTLTQ